MPGSLPRHARDDRSAVRSRQNQRPGNTSFFETAASQPPQDEVLITTSSADLPPQPLSNLILRSVRSTRLEG